MSAVLENIIKEINKLPDSEYYGRVTAVQGLFIEVSGIRANLSIGDRCHIYVGKGKKVVCELGLAFR